MNSVDNARYPGFDKVYACEFLIEVEAHSHVKDRSHMVDKRAMVCVLCEQLVYEDGHRFFTLSAHVIEETP